MKKLLSIIVFALLTNLLTAQVSKTVNVTTAGTLSSLLNANEKSTVTNLTITGSIDARDVKCMRDEIINLAVIDLTTVTIREYIGNDGTYLPSTTYQANEIPENSFSNPLTGIGKTTLKTFIFPTSITSIGRAAFNQCTGLTGNLSIGNNVVSIKDFAFSNCNKLNGSLVLGNNLKTIGNYAFNSSGLSGTLTIPNSVTSVGNCAFKNCSRFTGNLNLGNSLTSIGSDAFYNCDGFTGSLVIPNTVTTIGEYAFYSCGGFFGSLTLGSSLKYIASYAFIYCNGITVINSLNPTPPSIMLSFSDVPVSIVFVPVQSIQTYQKASGWSGYNIQALSTSIQKLSIVQTNIYSTSTQIVIEGTASGEKIEIYTLEGRLINKQKSVGDRTVIPVQRGAVYLVKTEEKTFKVIL